MSDPQDLLRTLAPQVLGYLAARHGQFDACEDAVQEALLAAHRQWPAEGVPSNPRGWLITVAQRRLTDEWRSEGRGRPAQLFRYAPRKRRSQRRGVRFDLLVG